jgi:hypothetical protein
VELGDDGAYEEAVIGQEAIYTEAKIEKAIGMFEGPYATLDSGAETYVMGGTSGTLA